MITFLIACPVHRLGLTLPPSIPARADEVIEQGEGGQMRNHAAAISIAQAYAARAVARASANRRSGGRARRKHRENYVGRRWLPRNPAEC
jgi:hypothetical protein